MTLVLLTGATRGIGRVGAIELARQGAEVALVGLTSLLRDRLEAGRVVTTASDAHSDEQVIAPSAQAQDDTLAAGLWERSAELAGISSPAVHG